jgi:hypothetical protein
MKNLKQGDAFDHTGSWMVREGRFVVGDGLTSIRGLRRTNTIGFFGPDGADQPY